MVPAAFVILPSLPLTPNGKLDRDALPAPALDEPEKPFVAPSTPVEEELARIWGEVLNRSQVGVQDNFFDLGGHSLLAAQCVSRIRESLGVELALQSLFETATLADLADLVVRTELEQVDEESLREMLDNMDEDELRALLAGEQELELEGGGGGGETR
jgi:acyl carrier protein